MESIRNKINAKLVSNKKDYLKWTSKPSYMSHKIFDNDLVAICKNKVTLTPNKPAYIGMCLLELSKVLMYKFHYGNNSRLLFTETDSLIYEIKTEDVCAESEKSKYYNFMEYYEILRKLKIL